jgi:hypothetical protein
MWQALAELLYHAGRELEEEVKGKESLLEFKETETEVSLHSKPQAAVLHWGYLNVAGCSWAEPWLKIQETETGVRETGFFVRFWCC